MFQPPKSLYRLTKNSFGMQEYVIPAEEQPAARTIRIPAQDFCGSGVWMTGRLKIDDVVLCESKYDDHGYYNYYLIHCPSTDGASGNRILSLIPHSFVGTCCKGDLVAELSLQQYGTLLKGEDLYIPDFLQRLAA